MDYERNKHLKELLKGFESSRVFGHMHPYDLYRQWLEAVWAMLEARNTIAEYLNT